MPRFNYFKKEFVCKIVYYGMISSGKTTNLEYIHKNTPLNYRSKLMHTDEGGIYFEYFAGLDCLGPQKNIQKKLQLCTYSDTDTENLSNVTETIIKSVDGIIFVVDSQKQKLQENIMILQNLQNNLAKYERKITDIPLIIQWNKRDLPEILDIPTLEKKINYLGVGTEPAIAITGKGVFDTLQRCSSITMKAAIEYAKTTVITR